jgi:putative hydrolase of HD superfamily
MGLGRFFIELTNFFTIYRWNNRPAVIKFTEADNAFHSSVMSLLFFQNLSKNEIIKIIHNRIMHELPKLILSDVSLEVKDKIKEINKQILLSLTEESYKDLKIHFDKEFSERFFVNHEFDSDVSNAVKLITLFVSKKEVDLNSRIFSEYYSTPKKDIEDKILNTKSSYKGYIENIQESILNVTIRMNSMTRWNKNHRHIKNTVSSHSFYVLIIAYILALYNNENENTIYDIISASILHDLPEAFTGDVITPTKRKVKGLENIISDIEKDFLITWKNSNENISDFVKKHEKHILNPFDEVYGKYVRTADLLAALNECAIEIITGNQNDTFRKAFFDIKKELKKISPIDISDILDEIEYNTF